MKILQVLPEMNSGGVERGTVDFARYLVRQGHTSLVMSAGGRMVSLLEEEGSTHIEFPVHKKSFSSLLKVRSLRALLQTLDVDVVHVRSRVPAWMIWLAIRKLPTKQRPALVSTFHGLYSINAYSAIMGCGDQVIAISQCVQDYITRNYPKVDHQNITLVHRGVDTQQFPSNHTVPDEWKTALFQQYPQLNSAPLIMMPGRLSRWKGQTEFIDMIATLIARKTPCHGLILGSPTPGKESYLAELKARVKAKKLDAHITFLTHSDQIAHLYALSSVVCNLSQHPEPFGRTVIEALAMGVPVVSYDYGGPAESLSHCFPQGLVPVGDQKALCQAVETCLTERPDIQLPAQFTLEHQAAATLNVYQKALTSRAST